MSKPDDIPQDVWKVAEDTLDTMLANHGYEGWRADSIDTIARAIMAATLAEREGCAKCAEAEGAYPELNVWNGGPDWFKHGLRIAGAIRKRGEP